MRRLLAQKGYRLIYSVAGPGVMNALLEDRVLDRLYLTQVDTLVGGEEFHTLYSAAAGQNDQTLALQALYRCEPEDAPAQQFSVYDVLCTREAG